MILKEKFLEDLHNMLSTETDISMDTDLLDIDEWDSFSATTFLVMINEKYHIKAEPFTIAEAVSVEDLYDIVRDSINY